MIDPSIDTIAATGPISFIVPALNEELNLFDTIAEIRLAADQCDYEIVIVNDGSTDKTAEIADELARQDARIKVVHNQQNMGLGGAYRVAVGAASKDYVLMLPGDNSFPAASIAGILKAVGKADIVIPYVANPQVRTLLRRIISRTYVLVVNSMFGINLRYHNGPVVHRLKLLRSITIETAGFAYQAEILIKLLSRGASFYEVPIALTQRGDRNSRAFRLSNIARVINALLTLFIDIRIRGRY